MSLRERLSKWVCGGTKEKDVHIDVHPHRRPEPTSPKPDFIVYDGWVRRYECTECKEIHPPSDDFVCTKCGSVSFNKRVARIARCYTYEWRPYRPYYFLEGEITYCWQTRASKSYWDVKEELSLEQTISKILKK